MKILMLGNSLTAANHMPVMLAQKLDAEVTVHARGGARLAEQLNPETKMGARTAQVLRERNFDYVILQEMSHGPATATERYLDSVRKLAKLVREAGAEPVLYATWVFRPGCEKLESIGMDAEEMHRQMQEAFRAAVENDALAASANSASATEGNQLLLANVGEAFRERGFADEHYAPDGLHPSEEGSRLAAEVIADVISNREHEV